MIHPGRKEPRYAVWHRAPSVVADDGFGLVWLIDRLDFLLGQLDVNAAYKDRGLASWSQGDTEWLSRTDDVL